MSIITEQANDNYDDERTRKDRFDQSINQQQSWTIYAMHFVRNFYLSHISQSFLVFTKNFVNFASPS